MSQTRVPVSRLIAGSVFLAVLAISLVRSLLAAWADSAFRVGGVGNLRTAERLVSGNARYPYSVALALQQSEPTSPAIEEDFALAVSRNPRYSDALLAWSVERELRGDKTGAESLLLQARSTDHTLRPSWALANFYLRQGNLQKFWPAARASLDIIGKTGLAAGRFDPNPVYQLCWNMTDNGALIFSQAIPEDRVIRSHYLGFLLTTGRLDAATQVADSALPGAQPFELGFLLPYCNHLIGKNRIPEALKAWNSLADQKLIPHTALDPTRGIFLTNSDFSSPPAHVGFNWRPVFPESIRFTFVQPGHGYRFDFDANAPEQFPLLLQFVPVIGGKLYRLTMHFESDMNIEASGFVWSAKDLSNGKPLEVRDAEAKRGGYQFVDFEVPRFATAVALQLGYERKSGTVRPQGYLQLLDVTLTAR